MADNYKQKGDSVRVTLSAAATAGEPILLNGRVVIPVTDGESGDEIECYDEGVFECAKVTGTAFTQFDTLYWDDGNSRFTTASTGNTKCAIAAYDAASSAALCQVKLQNTI